MLNCTQNRMVLNRFHFIKKGIHAMNQYEERLQKAILELKKNHFHQMIVTDPVTIMYLTGEHVAPFERIWALYLTDKGQCCLFANRLFVLSDTPILPVLWHTDIEDPAAAMASVTDHTLPLGIDKSMKAGILLALQEYHAGISYHNTSFALDAVRGRKSKEEQEKMIAASLINDVAMEQFKALIHEGVTEISVASKLEAIYRSLGAEGHSFSPIVSFGANAADPHHEPDDTVIREGDVVLFDVGCIKDGYCSDMTRCFFYKKASERQREIYEIVKKANELGEQSMKPGVTFASADKAAREYITAAGYGPNFTHRLGHSIGMEVHESGDVSSVNENLFEPGRCISCEPGIYLPGDFGIRIEDLCLITEDGVTVLNHYSKELEIIG